MAEENEVQKMLKAIQEKRAYNQTQLAGRLGVAKSQVSKWLDGTIPRFETVLKIQKLYNEAV